MIILRLISQINLPPCPTRSALLGLTNEFEKGVKRQNLFCQQSVLRYWCVDTQEKKPFSFIFFSLFMFLLPLNTTYQQDVSLYVNAGKLYVFKPLVLQQVAAISTQKTRNCFHPRARKLVISYQHSSKRTSTVSTTPSESHMRYESPMTLTEACYALFTCPLWRILFYSEPRRGPHRAGLWLLYAFNSSIVFN
jgi:hypothetical protein